MPNNNVSSTSSASVSNSNSITIQDGTSFQTNTIGDYQTNTIGDYTINTGGGILYTSPVIDTSSQGHLFFNYNSDIVISNKITLKAREDNFIIVKKSNLAITWNSELSSWDIFQIEEFEENFSDYKNKKEKKKESKKTEDLKIVSGTSSVSFTSIVPNDTINSLLDIDGNIYIDLKDEKVYKYSEEEDNWSRKELGKFKLKIYRKAKKGELKKRNNRALLVERVNVGKFEAKYIPNYLQNFTWNSFGGTFIGGNTITINNDNLLYVQNDIGTITTTPNTSNFTVSTDATGGYNNYGVHGTATTYTGATTLNNLTII